MGVWEERKWGMQATNSQLEGYDCHVTFYPAILSYKPVTIRVDLMKIDTLSVSISQTTSSTVTESPTSEISLVLIDFSSHRHFKIQ